MSCQKTGARRGGGATGPVTSTVQTPTRNDPSSWRDEMRPVGRCVRRGLALVNRAECTDDLNESTA